MMQRVLIADDGCAGLNVDFPRNLAKSVTVE